MLLTRKKVSLLFASTSLKLGCWNSGRFLRIIINYVSRKLILQQDRHMRLLSYISGQTTYAKQKVQKTFLACCRRAIFKPFKCRDKQASASNCTYVSALHECIKGNRGIVLLIFNLGIRWRPSGQIHAPPQYPLTRRMGVPHSRSGK
jgi:hypothetical protein